MVKTPLLENPSRSDEIIQFIEDSLRKNGPKSHQKSKISSTLIFKTDKNSRLESDLSKFGEICGLEKFDVVWKVFQEISKKNDFFF